MGELRAVLRLAALAPWTFGLWVVHLLAGAAAPLAPAVSSRARRGLRRVWARGALALLCVRVETLGQAPRAPFLMVSNHLSYLDVAVLMAHAGATFLSKAEVADWPVVGMLARSAGTLFIDRARKADLARVLGELRSALDHGQGVVFFPEGTSSQGREVLPFKSGLFEVAAEAGIAVHCASLSYAVPPGATPAHLSVCWWGDMAFTRHFLHMLRLPSIRATLEFAPAALAPTDRRSLARQARDEVVARFRPVTA